MAITRRAIKLALLIATITLQGRAAPPEVTIFVSPGARPIEDGSAAMPFHRISQAISAAHVIRETEPKVKIIISVSAGTFVGVRAPTVPTADEDRFPLKLDLSDVELRGATQLADDPQNGVPDFAEPGGTILMMRPGDATQALSGGEAIIVITPPLNRSISDATVEGLELDGVYRGGHGILVDRTMDFTIRGNAFRRFVNGVRTRGSSGRIKMNVSRDNRDTGAVCTGGSVKFPAKVQLWANNMNSNEIGILLVGTGTYKLLVPGAPPLQTTFDLDSAQDRQEVPDTLQADVLGNNLESNSLAGLRVFLKGQAAATYNTADPSQPFATRIRVHTRNNSFIGNGRYGISIDAGFPERQVPRLTYQSEFHGRFETDSFVGNGTARGFFGFIRLQVALGLASPQNWQADEVSTFHISYDNGELNGFNIAHPAFDAVTGLVLGNRLIVNDQVLDFGTCIGTCP